MVSTKKDSEGRVIALAEWRVVDRFGQEPLHCEKPGEYAWINHVWVHESMRTRNKFNALLRDFILEGYRRFPQLKQVYWTRGKYNRRMSCYDIRRLLNESLRKIS